MDIEYNEENHLAVPEYWRKVAISEGFDIEGIKGSQVMNGLMRYDCEDLGDVDDYAETPMVRRYAKMGLHRYNMLNGTNLEFHRLIKFNMFMNLVSSYFITLVAKECGTQRLFQVRVDENQYGCLNCAVSIARLKGFQEEGPTLGPRQDPDFDKDELPGWPCDDDINDSRRFYLVEGPELMSNDWIKVYLELAVYTYDRFILEADLSKLEVVKVAIETSNGDVGPPSERLNARKATVYITYKGLAIRGAGEDVERKAIVRRALNESTRYLSLKGELCRREEDLDNTFTFSRFV